MDPPIVSEGAVAVLRDLLERSGRTEGGLTWEHALRSLVAVVASAADASSALLAVRGERSHHLIPIVRTGRYETAFSGPISARTGAAGAAMRSRQATLHRDLSTDEEASAAERAARIGPLYAQPLQAGGRVAGVLCLGRDRGAEPFSDADVAVVGLYEAIASEILVVLPGLGPPDEAETPPRDRELMNSLRHAVNNPLAVIMGQAQILMRDPTIKDDPYLVQSMEAVLEAGERIRTVLRGLTAADESAQ